jgi:hypothetical protein
MQKRLTTKDLSQKKLKEQLQYDPKTGIFVWIATRSGIKKGSIAGCINILGYRHIKIDGKRYRAARLAWLYMEGFFPENEVDHINRIKHDDRWNNLRHVNRQCNARNRGTLKNNKSGIVGVCWKSKIKSWASEITVNKKTIHLCYSKSKAEAVKARWKAEKKYNWPNCNGTSSAYLYLKERGLV